MALSADPLPVCEALIAAGYSVSLRGFSAIDAYLGRDALPFVTAGTDAALPALARLFDLRFPGPALADGAVRAGDRDWYFRCIDGADPDDAPAAPPPWTLLSFSRDAASGRFQDPAGIYPLLREIRAGLFSPAKLGAPHPRAGRNRALSSAAVILARYAGRREGRATLLEKIDALPADLPLGLEEQRVLLLGLLSSPDPGAGFSLLQEAGFLRETWPLIAALDDVDHSKEFHPEGNVFNHTMETLSHRKQGPGGAFDLTLSLALLLHDAGKPQAASSGGKRFDGHAELGAAAARRFLRDLGFDDALSADASWLVKNHMLPAALKKLPLVRTEEAMSSPLFPLLMELYRCDESSSFKGLDGYYENSAAYRRYRKMAANPYRSKTAPGTTK